MLDGAQSGADFIFHQYVKASHGRDVRILIVNGNAIAAMERRSTDGSFKSNISLGGVDAAFTPPPEMAALAIKVASVLNLDVAGVDILFDDDGYRICEANSSPGFQGLEKACRISVPDAIFDSMHIRLGLPVQTRRSGWQRFLESISSTVTGTQTQFDQDEGCCRVIDWRTAVCSG